MQTFLIAGSGVALLAAIIFLVVATLKAGKLNAIYAYAFFTGSMLLLALYLFQWSFTFAPVTQDIQLTPSLAPINTGLGPWGQILGGGIVAALLTLGGHELIACYRKPKLKVDFKKALIFLRENTDKNRESYWLRVRVMNSGRSVAKGCTARITRFMNGSFQIDYDPLILHWIEVPWECEPFKAVDLRRREERYLDMLIQKEEDPSKLFLFTPPLYEPKPLDYLKELPTGTSWIEITVYAENAEPCPKKYQIKTGKSHIKWENGHIKWDDNATYKTISLEEL